MGTATDASPRFRARMAGLFYLLNILTAILALVFSSRRLHAYSQASLLVATACYVVVTLLFYFIFKPVNQRLSLVAAIVSLAGCAVSTLNTFHVELHIDPLVFFGIYCLLVGYLIFRSMFLPWILGALMTIAGLGWVTFVSPALAQRLLPYNMAPGVIGELTLTVWLLTVGVNAQRWQKQAGAVGS